MSVTTQSRHSLTQPPHLALTVSSSPVLASRPSLSEDEDDIFSSTTRVDPLHVWPFSVESKRPPLPYEGGLVGELSPLSPSTSTTSFETTSTPLSSRFFSLLSPFASSYTL